MGTLVRPTAAILFAGLQLAACSGGGKKEDLAAPAGKAQEMPLVHEYVLGFGEAVRLEGGLVLEFTNVAEDSRCATGVTCVWAGNARILLTGVSQKGTTVIGLNTNAQSGPDNAMIDAAYQVTLRKLEPYPVQDAQTGSSSVPVSAYEATIFVDGVNWPATHQGS